MYWNHCHILVKNSLGQYRKISFVVCIVPTRPYTQSTKIDTDLWPRDPKSIGSLLSLSTTYMWSLKKIWLKLQFESDRAKTVVCIVSTRQGATDARTHARTHPLTHSPNHTRMAALLYPLQRFCEGITKSCATFQLNVSKHVGEKCEKRADGDRDGRRVGRTETRTDITIP